MKATFKNINPNLWHSNLITDDESPLFTIEKKDNFFILKFWDRYEDVINGTALNTLIQATEQANNFITKNNVWTKKEFSKIQDGYFNEVFQTWIFKYYPHEAPNKVFWATADKEGFFDGGDEYKTLKEAKEAAENYIYSI